LSEPFAAQVFKVQANMDPRHRDRVAFLRLWSGRFERGMRAVNARTGKPFTIAHAHEVFGDERAVLDEAFPGDVIGVVNAGDLRVGDTLHADGAPVTFPPIPTLAPEHFVRIRNRDASRHKQFHRGLEQLAQEGVMHLLRRDPAADPTPVLAGVGPLQFEVAVERLQGEFGCTVGLDATPWRLARRTDDAGAELLGKTSHAEILYSADGTKLALFTSEFLLALVERDHPEVTLDRMLQR
ncbi:MAG: peptide chain release factor 3, partial [Actinomycetota bacterium]|nr:peptide chain release factor 3 [Actinomycetota bacterium]